MIGEIKERLYISEPNQIYAIECGNYEITRYLSMKLLKISSFSLSKTFNVANTAHFLQKQISALNNNINCVSLNNFRMKFGTKFSWEINKFI